MIRRRLFTLASALGLLMCMATVVLWVRSYWAADRLMWLEEESRGTFGPCPPHVSAVVGFCAHGQLLFGAFIQKNEGAEEWSGGWFYDKNPTVGFAVRSGDTLFDHAGLEIRRYPFRDLTGYSVTGPLWLILLFTAITPALWWWKRLRHVRTGVCPTCGYDLTGNTSGVCPECGTAVAGKSEGVA